MFKNFFILVVTVWLVHQTQAASVGTASRIINGRPANPDISVAHNAFIVYLNANGAGFHGGGSIISSNAILTSARNIVGWVRWTVGVGSTTLNSLTNIDSTTAVAYPRHDPNLFPHDIGIILLPTRLQFSATIQPIPIPTSTTYEPFPNEQLRIMGFGDTLESSLGVRSPFLMEGFQRVISADTCRNSLGLIHNPPFTFCGQQAPLDFFAGNSICGGNFGSGAITQMQLVNTLVGIATEIAFNCDVTRPTLYTNVALYRGWIVEVVGQLMV